MDKVKTITARLGHMDSNTLGRFAFLFRLTKCLSPDSISVFLSVILCRY